MVSETKKRNNKKWDKNNTKSFSVKLFLKTDKDIIEHLQKIENKNAYIKQLIRKDIKNRGTGKQE